MQKTYNEDKLPDKIDGIDVVQDIFVAMDCLTKGQTIVRYEFGDSMTPILTSGQFCKLIPISEVDEIKQGDCVFAVVNGSIGTHMVWMVSENEAGKFYCIATTQGTVIGWTDEILAKSIGIPHYVKESKKKGKKLQIPTSSYGIFNTSISTATLDEMTRRYNRNVRTDVAVEPIAPNVPNSSQEMVEDEEIHDAPTWEEMDEETPYGISSNDAVEAVLNRMRERISN